MVGKGQRRREKNYRAAHGGGHSSRLPPPPKASDVDALPSKLRRIIDFTTKDSSKVSDNGERKRKRKDDDKPEPGTGSNNKMARLEEGGYAEKLITPKNKDGNNEIAQKDARDKKKAKRKRKQVDDLRFESITQVLGSTSLKRRERKKKYLEAKKKKHKKAKLEDTDFPGHEEIKFGEIVEAPPKLSAVPKAMKSVQDASHERLRLQAVEAYRERKGWASRPGVQLPGPVSLNTSF